MSRLPSRYHKQTMEVIRILGHGMTVKWAHGGVIGGCKVIREKSIEPFLIVDSKNQESVDSKDNDDKDFELHPV
jgi:hypothetical protein